MMARESHTTPLLSREVVRENRVNQSGSVALSTEAMRGPPLAPLIDKMAFPTPNFGATNQAVVSLNPVPLRQFKAGSIKSEHLTV